MQSKAPKKQKELTVSEKELLLILKYRKAPALLKAAIDRIINQIQ